MVDMPIPLHCRTSALLLRSAFTQQAGLYLTHMYLKPLRGTAQSCPHNVLYSMSSGPHLQLISSLYVSEPSLPVSQDGELPQGSDTVSASPIIPVLVGPTEEYLGYKLSGDDELLIERESDKENDDPDQHNYAFSRHLVKATSDAWVFASFCRRHGMDSVFKTMSIIEAFNALTRHTKHLDHMYPTDFREEMARSLMWVCKRNIYHRDLFRSLNYLSSLAQLLDCMKPNGSICHAHTVRIPPPCWDNICSQTLLALTTWRVHFPGRATSSDQVPSQEAGQTVQTRLVDSRHVHLDKLCPNDSGHRQKAGDIQAGQHFSLGRGEHRDRPVGVSLRVVRVWQTSLGVSLCINSMGARFNTLTPISLPVLAASSQTMQCCDHLGYPLNLTDKQSDLLLDIICQLFPLPTLNVDSIITNSIDARADMTISIQIVDLTTHFNEGQNSLLRNPRNLWLVIVAFHVYYDKTLWAA